ncbi:hypothetical protein Sjap_013234 [Stephania japonica]|uniref:Uncharacterized protein n=1 Tax=Stephania japonica TaxID=461633 RepID=A0AAP0IZH3_9MAGN
MAERTTTLAGAESMLRSRDNDGGAEATIRVEAMTAEWTGAERTEKMAEKRGDREEAEKRDQEEAEKRDRSKCMFWRRRGTALS